MTGQSATGTAAASSSSSSRTRAAGAAPAAPAASSSSLSSSSTAAARGGAPFSHTAIPALESFDAELQSRFAKLEDTAAGFSSDGWHFVCEMSGVTVTRTDQATEPGHTCTKGVAHIRDRAVRIYELVANVPMYHEWVDRIVRSECVRRVNGHSAYNCVEFAGVWPVSGREVCFMQTAARKPDGTILVLWHADAALESSVKQRKGVVRASVGPSGFVIQPLDISVTGPDAEVCLTTCVLQFDMKAWIPAAWTDGIATVQHFLLSAIVDALANDPAAPAAARPAATDHSALRQALIQRRDALVAHLQSIDAQNDGKPKTEDQLTSIMAIASELSDVAERLKALEGSED